MYINFVLNDPTILSWGEKVKVYTLSEVFLLIVTNNHPLVFIQLAIFIEEEEEEEYFIDQLRTHKGHSNCND
jgi:hypothetical protein